MLAEFPLLCSAMTKGDQVQLSSASSKIQVQPSMLKFVKRKSLQDIVAKLISVDGFSANAICKSDFIREAFNKDGHHLPKDATNIMRLVKRFYDEARSETINNILRVKANKFGITFDEWSSLRNRRYLNVNNHFGPGGIR